MLNFLEQYVTVDIVEGRLQAHDQIHKYLDQGEELWNWNYLDFFLGTYDGKMLKEKKKPTWPHTTQRCAL